jgi:tRNA-specific 2-thiouridylase
MSIASPQQQHIYVGMSGGVDSSLTAALLLEQGYRVTGVYMKNWAQEWDVFDCPWAQDLDDASRVADQLGIPFKVFDFRQTYRQKVVDYMIAEYQAGRTPNPDVMCNQEVKFGIFLRTALAEGADGVATGHYARVADGQLRAGLDRNKDQSYFLYRVTQQALRQTLMPIGHFTKPQVRQMAANRGLATATKKDSQGICFIGQVDLKVFLRQYVQAVPGEVRTLDNQILGQHEGAIFYTIGQRQGLGIGGGKPLFVVGKDMKHNIVYVTTEDHSPDLWQSEVILDQIHWINAMPDLGKTYQVRVRYRAPLVEANLKPLEGGGLALTLHQPQRAIAPGQSVVIYDQDLVLGGGIIAMANQVSSVESPSQARIMLAA